MRLSSHLKVGCDAADSDGATPPASIPCTQWAHKYQAQLSLELAELTVTVSDTHLRAVLG
jgi:hypothetical protein